MNLHYIYAFSTNEWTPLDSRNVPISHMQLNETGQLWSLVNAGGIDIFRLFLLEKWGGGHQPLVSFHYR